MFTIIGGILLALLVFTFIVFFHELGHFGLAKIFGVKVEEFGIGIPPRIRKLWKDHSGTEYTVNWLPIGGFVRLKGEDMSLDMKDADALVSKPAWQQMGIILAGVTMNFLLAGILLSGLFWVGVEPLAVNTKFDTATKTKLIPDFDQAIAEGWVRTDGLLLEPLSGSVAEISGVRKDDILLSIDGKAVNSPQTMIDTVKTASSTLVFHIQRDKQEIDLSIAPKDGKIGSYVSYHVTGLDQNFRYAYPFPQAVREGFTETYQQSKLALELIGSLFRKLIHPNSALERQEAIDSVGGPIAVGNLFVSLVNAKVGISVVLVLTALLSINLGVFNLLPIPALDGGRFFFMLLNEGVRAIFGKRAIKAHIEQYAHVVGFALLILLSILVAYHDVLKLLTQTNK